MEQRTKNCVRAKLNMMANLAEQAKRIADEVFDMIYEDSDDYDDIQDALAKLQNCECDAEYAMKRLEYDGIISRSGITEDGPEMRIPEVVFDKVGALEVKLASGEGAIVTYINVDDEDGTPYAGVKYCAEDYAFDIFETSKAKVKG